MLQYLKLIFFILISNILIIGVDSTINPLQTLSYPKDVRRLAYTKDLIKFLKFYGYNAERYEVETADGYILDLYRIPNKNKKPILLMHGLLVSGSCYFTPGPENPGLAYFLHNQGYDVWLGNARGTDYGRQHVNLNPDVDIEFWKFSWHEIGVYDLPAIIDLIMDKTNKTSLSYVGHSQGTTAFFVMASMLPEYQKKIDVMHAMAPAVFLQRLRYSGALAIYRYFNQPLSGDVDPQIWPLTQICLSTQLTLDICVSFTEQIVGPDFRKINMTLMPIYLKHLSTASIRQIGHYYQVHLTGKFETFDENFLRSKKLNTKPYPLEAVKTPVALYYAKNDYLVHPSNVAKLKKRLPNVVLDYLAPNERWNHADFIIATDVKVLYNKMLDVQRENEKDVDSDEDDEDAEDDDSKKDEV